MHSSYPIYAKCNIKRKVSIVNLFTFHSYTHVKWYFKTMFLLETLFPQTIDNIQELYCLSVCLTLFGSCLYIYSLKMKNYQKLKVGNNVIHVIHVNWGKVKVTSLSKWYLSIKVLRWNGGVNFSLKPYVILYILKIFLSHIPRF